MVQCEMCGTEVADPSRIKVEGAELDVCDSCTDFGTELQQGSSGSSTSTKYSTGGSSSGASGSSGGTGSSTSSTSSSSGRGSGPGGDMFEDIDDLAQDYDDLLRDAREGRDMSQEDLANELNEKASLIQKLERGSILPSDEVQHKLERELDIDLGAGSGGGDTEWQGDSAAGEYTLGDVVERKD
jgi:putative transcription factor